MSNTSTVTPYASDSASTAVAACIGGAVLVGAAAVTWLVQENEQDRVATARHRDRARRERVATAAPSPVCSVALTLTAREPLLQAASQLGYQVESSTGVSPSTILLARPTGERLAIERSDAGRLLVHTTGARTRVNELVRQHTVERALEHPRSSGMVVRTKRLSTGEVQIAAREPQPVGRAGQATVLAQVRDDGTAWVDVDGVKGRRCEAITQGLAHAVGAEIDAQHKKPAWHQQPGEPVRTRPRKLRV